MPNLSPFSIPSADRSWFDKDAKPNFTAYTKLLPNPFTALQIGVFRGDASKWLLDTYPNITLTDVDSWEGVNHIPNPSMPFDIDFTIAEKAYDAQIGRRDNVTKLKMSSDQFFNSYTGRPFNFIYIDGDHHASQALTDLQNAHEILTSGGILAFDDYTNGCFDLLPDQQPYLAMKTFYNEHLDSYTGLVSNNQVWLRKNV